ncbi:MAG TPA: hypothetical protein VGJ06_11100 [Candidatus Acidoferrum sp.]|jgi:hypothetical protein
MKVRFRTLLLAAIALLIIWYFTGGRNHIAYYEYIRQAKAQGTFSPMMLEHWDNGGILFFASGIGIYIVLAVSAIQGIGILVKKFSKAKAQ